jgi:hypothetical protein
MEVLVEWKQAVGLHFAKDSPQFLLNAVDSVEERATVDSHPAAAQFPICSQQEVKSEDLVIEF